MYSGVINQTWPRGQVKIHTDYSDLDFKTFLNCFFIRLASYLLLYEALPFLVCCSLLLGKILRPSV